MNGLLAAFEGYGELLALAGGMLYVLAQISGIFGKRKPPESQAEKPAAAPPHAARPSRGAKPPTPPRATPARPAAQRPTTQMSPVPGTRAKVAPPRVRPTPIPPSAPQARPAMRSPTPMAGPQHAVAVDHRRTTKPQPRKQPQPQGVREATAVRQLQRLSAHELIAHPETGKQHLGHSKPEQQRRRRLTETEKLLRVLRSRSGTRAAIQLAEILAPPLALRDDRLQL